MAYKKLKLWFDKKLAQNLAIKVNAIDPSFNKTRFVKEINQKISKLELKDRLEVFADAFHQEFNQDFKYGIELLLQILGPENEEETGMFTNYYWIMPIATYVEKYGLDHFKLSMKAIEAITKRNTGEYTIRPYLERQTKTTLKIVEKWSRSKNKHVRRLASEGIRPRLPWAKKLDIFIDNPTSLLPILENLKDDPSKYVQKSVANCLNDIMKDNPKIGKKIVNRWNIKKISKERTWIIKHGLRTLIKQKDSWAKKLVDNFQNKK